MFATVIDGSASRGFVPVGAAALASEHFGAATGTSEDCDGDCMDSGDDGTDGNTDDC